MKLLLLGLATLTFTTATWAAPTDGIRPVLTAQPDGEFILLDGTDSGGIKHVLHSEPVGGLSVGLAVQRLFGGLTPQFDYSIRQIRFSGANGESVQYSSGYYQAYSAGLEAQILASWVASGKIGYADQIFLRSPSAEAITVDRVRTPVASVQTDFGFYQYKGFLFSGHAKVFVYFPVSTPDYSASAGYGIEPSVSTTHVFSKLLSGSAEAYYLRRIQNSTAFDLTEQDFGLALSFQLTL